MAVSPNLFASDAVLCFLLRTVDVGISYNGMLVVRTAESAECRIHGRARQAVRIWMMLSVSGGELLDLELDFVVAENVQSSTRET
jgi:hypothetical protein